MSKIWAFDHVENKQTLYCKRNCIKNLCIFLKEQTKDAVDFESHEDAKVCFYFSKIV